MSWMVVQLMEHLRVLKSFQKAYNLEIHEYPFDRMDLQRNRLLELTPKNSWVIAIDQDEQLNHKAQKDIRETIDSIDPGVYAKSSRILPVTIGMPFYNLIQDLHHHTESWIGMLNEKLFYYDEDIHFIRPYHCHLTYEGETEVMMLRPPQGWALFHYALLNEERVQSAPEDIRSGKRDYGLEEWDLSKRSVNDLSEHLWP
jgi:hypothetical protein